MDSTSPVGCKRNRFLIRQPRIKRDSDTSQQSPDVIELEHTSSRNLLSVPPKIERHSSEPAPSIAPSSPQLLSVPGQSTHLLVKQHSHPLLPSNHSPPLSLTSSGNFSLHRQLSQPTPTSAVISSGDTMFSTSACILPTNTITSSPAMVQFVPSIPIKHETIETSPSKASTPIVLVQDQLPTGSGSEQHLNPIRVKTDELQRSASSPQTAREPSLENPRSSHCPVIRPGPALGCNFCWNTIDAHGRILRRKTKYHCPECQTNLCIVPCFQEYHERQGSDNPSSENLSTLSSSNNKGLSSASLRYYPKTGSI